MIEPGHYTKNSLDSILCSEKRLIIKLIKSQDDQLIKISLTHQIIKSIEFEIR